jgi:nitrile hydratase accessory protein
MPREGDTPVFSAPWQARAFALVLSLRDGGVFTWDEWAQALAASIRTAQEAGDPDTGETYYLHWLAALERLLVQKGITGKGMLGITRDAWDATARATPHGQPVELSQPVEQDDGAVTVSGKYPENGGQVRGRSPVPEMRTSPRNPMTHPAR